MMTPDGDASGINADPKFVNPNTDGWLNDFKLQTGSPGMASGMLITNNGGRDYFGSSVSATRVPNRGVDNSQAESTAVNRWKTK